MDGIAMRSTWVTLSIVLALAFVGASAVAAELYDGPGTIEGDVVWTNESFVLGGSVYVNENASLTLVNTSLYPAVNFTNATLIVGYGPVSFIDSMLDGGRWRTVISSSSEVTVVGSAFTNASYGILTGANLTVSGSTFTDLEYGLRSGGDTLSISDTVFERCDYGFMSYSWETLMDNVSFINTTFMVGNVFSTTATLTGIMIDGAGEGISSSGTDIKVQVVATNVKEENCDAGCGGPSVTGSVLITGGGKLNLVDSDISDSDGGIIGYHSDIEVENTTFYDLKGGLYGYMMQGNVSNSTFIDSGIGLEASRSDIGFIDCTFTNMSVEARQWWVVRVNVVDPYGDDVRSAVISIIDSEGNVTEGTTNVAGFHDTGIIAYQRINGSDVIYGPYDVIVEKDGFEAEVTNITLEDDYTVDVFLPYYKPDINVTGITTKGRGRVTLRATVANTGDHVAENVTVTFTYKAGFNVIVIDTVDVGDIEADGTGTAEVVWDARDVIAEGHDEFQITANAEADNDDPTGSKGDNYGSIMLDVSEIEDEDEEPSPALVAIIIAMLIIIAFLVIKFVTRTREASGDERDTPKTWTETKARSRKVRETDVPRTHRGKTPAPKGRAPGRRQPPVK